MSRHVLSIDASNIKDKAKYDLIPIKFQNGETLQVNFSKLASQSNYIRDKYNYLEVLDLIQAEIEEIEKKFSISEESIKLFMHLIQEEKVNVPIELYTDIYKLSEYFQTPNFIAALDKTREESSDLNFQIQILYDSETAKKILETKLLSKIENFLKERINQCLKNKKFKKLSMPTICRIIEQSKKNVDLNLLVDFILESAHTRFILFRFIELDKIKEKKAKDLIKFIDEQDETTKNMYLEYMPFNLSFINYLMNTKDQLLVEKDQLLVEKDQLLVEKDQLLIEKNQLLIEKNQTKERINQVLEPLYQCQEINNRSISSPKKKK